MYDMIKKDIIDSYKDIIEILYIKCNLSEKIGEIPIQVSDYAFYKRNCPNSNLNSFVINKNQ